MHHVKISLSWQILIALILGITVGIILHNQLESYEWFIKNVLTPIGDIFIHLIKMIVVPIVISTLIIGISGINNTKKLGRLGLKTIIYFEVITTISIIVGLTLANIFQPGHGVDMSILTKTDISQYKKISENIQNIPYSLVHTILSLIPSNIFLSMVKGDMLQIIFFSVLFGIGLSTLPQKTKKPFLIIFKAISESMFKITNIIMLYAPIGVFGLISVTVSNFGVSSLLPLSKLVILIYFAIIFFALVILGTIARLCKLRIWMLIRILKKELILAYSTASSEMVLSRIIKKMENYGGSKSIVNFVIPTGYSLNLDGSTLHQSIAAIFIAQLYGIELSLHHEIILILTLMITSKGIAGIPGVSFIVLLTTLSSVGIPLEGLTFIAGIDRILDMARTALNVIGNALAALVISKWENKFDKQKSIEYEKKFIKKNKSIYQN
ncbi:Proton glutamate symport protein [Serratia symbiotica]|nr:Proton glutamate symport protein [Serratia symbiotica]